MRVQIKLFFNWLHWCWKFKEIAPWGVRYFRDAPPTKEDLLWAETYLKEHPEIVERAKRSD
jgi:hypothetical protein